MTHQDREQSTATAHVLQCMEIWNGSKSIENVVSSQGLDAWIFSQPYSGQQSGGDVHYLSLCVGGIVTRLVLADVAGHGELVASTSEALRRLLRRYMNVKGQDRLVADLNSEFTRNESDGRFATAVVATYWSHKHRLLLTNAGHPRPLIYKTANRQWTFLDDSSTDALDSASNFPLGIVDDSTYGHFEMNVESGDWLVLYTDALTEAADSEETLLGERGLLDIIRKIDVEQAPAELGRDLLGRVISYAGSLDSDDTTIIAIKFNDQYRQPGIIEKLKGYSKLISGS